MTAALKTTPFHARTALLNAGHAWRRWAGYVAASSYELQHEREYHAIRSSAGLLDITPLYKYLVRGRDAARLLDRVVTRDVARAAPGQVLYTTVVRRRRQGARRRHRRAARRAGIPPHLRRAQPALAGSERHRTRGRDRRRFRNHGGARAPGSFVAGDPSGPCRYRSVHSQVLQDFAGVARESLPGDDLPHRLHRRPGLRDLARCRRRAAGLGCVDRGRDAARHRARGTPRPRSRARGSRSHVDGRRLLLGAQGAHRGPDLDAVRARPRLDRGSREGPLRRAGRRSRGRRGAARSGN